MELLNAWVTSGRAMDLALVMVALEAAFLLGRNRRNGSTGKWGPVLLLLLPGVFLLLAMRDAATGSPARVALWMALSLPFHALDVRQRFFR
jgi:hypothetical protein